MRKPKFKRFSNTKLKASHCPTESLSALNRARAEVMVKEHSAMSTESEIVKDATFIAVEHALKELNELLDDRQTPTAMRVAILFSRSS